MWESKLAVIDLWYFKFKFLKINLGDVLSAGKLAAICYQKTISERVMQTSQDFGEVGKKCIFNILLVQTKKEIEFAFRTNHRDLLL